MVTTGIVIMYNLQDKVNQEDSEQNVVDGT